MSFNQALRSTLRARWIMRQKSRLIHLFRLQYSATINCPFCRAKVVEGLPFCCPDLEMMWEKTERTPEKAPAAQLLASGDPR
jgi:hypothetical protein